MIATMHNKFVEARYRLTIEEQRIILALISLIQPEDEDFKDYKIPVNVLQELTGTKRKDIYTAVKEAVERLLKRTIIIETEKDFEAFNFISYGRYRKGEGYFVISIDKHLKPYLLKLKEKFTRIPLKYIFPLRSTYAIRLYELLKQYENTGFRVDYLPNLREMLGVEPGEYIRFDNFERKVLKTAIKEINEKTDIEVSYEKKKTGRKITHIEFKIKPKNVNEGDTTQIEKIPSENIDIQGQEQMKDEKVDNVKSQSENNPMNVWEEIGRIRRKYRHILDEILSRVKRLNENQILFLLVNADENQFPKDILKEMIVGVDNNKSLNNPMGFLIKTLNIDTKQAKFKELTLISSKIDEDLFREKLKNMFVDGRSAKEYFKVYWDEVVKPAYAKGLINKDTMKILRYPLRLAVYDEIDNIIYVPVPDVIYKEWLENNFLEDIRKFLREKFNIENIVVEIVDIEEFQDEDF